LSLANREFCENVGAQAGMSQPRRACGANIALTPTRRSIWARPSRRSFRATT